MKTLPPVTGRPVRLGVLISGSGRTLSNFVDCIRSGELDAEIPVVIAGQPNCTGIRRARGTGLNSEVVVRTDFDSTQTFSEEIFRRLRFHSVDLVTLAGFLNLIEIPADFDCRVLNIHPSLIPAFCGRGYYGMKVHQSVIDRGVRVSGCTVHFADNEYDHGPIIVQRPVTIPESASVDDLAAMVFEQEKLAYPEAIRRVVSGRLVVDGNRTLMRR